eukprot:CAMPEP_0118925442 /NCGR_PEP_ID=MMETSP1169-20130426/3322_1 /TAXON_ID=36882 /ORGANISM="Pyramimonas obovata, Strain CCMP722" /LENGTH=489 /DNA_ID=CAMNT_0006866741 /DNA_START=257 /DNA_END=1726 /DNA_ORIENTATION=-
MSGGSFFDVLSKEACKKNTLLCVGLDPHSKELKENTPEAAKEFCAKLIENTHEYCCCYKPNAAFFECFGASGVEALHQVIALCKEKGVPVLLDAKRGDIGSTSEAYAEAAYKAANADALTASPYMGEDSMEPLMRDSSKGIFILTRTSNPGASDIQSLSVVDDSGNRAPLYESVAKLAQRWNEKYGNCGMVVGATAPNEMVAIRKVAPDPWILAPGVGFQGGDLGATVRAAVRADGLGLLLPVSRGISRAKDQSAEAKKLRDAINDEREKAVVAKVAQEKAEGHAGWTESKKKLADQLMEVGCVKFGTFTLKSGLTSPIYIDLRIPVAYPRLLAAIGEAFLPLLEGLEFTQLAALPYAAMPIGSAVSLAGSIPMIYPRKESKAYGTKADIEGVFKAGEQVVVIDDLITTGDSKFEGFAKLESGGLKVKDVVVLIDRESGGADLLAAKGYNLRAVFKFRDLLAYWQEQGKLTPEQVKEVDAFLLSSVKKV